jgi:CO dehydrogenase/acetyl-CoA synthase beta subunit
VLLCDHFVKRCVTVFEGRKVAQSFTRTHICVVRWDGEKVSQIANLKEEKLKII